MLLTTVVDAGAAALSSDIFFFRSPSPTATPTSFSKELSKVQPHLEFSQALRSHSETRRREISSVGEKYSVFERRPKKVTSRVPTQSCNRLAPRKLNLAFQVEVLENRTESVLVAPELLSIQEKEISELRFKLAAKESEIRTLQEKSVSLPNPSHSAVLKNVKDNIRKIENELSRVEIGVERLLHRSARNTGAQPMTARELSQNWDCESVAVETLVSGAVEPFLPNLMLDYMETTIALTVPGVDVGIDDTSEIVGSDIGGYGQGGSAARSLRAVVQRALEHLKASALYVEEVSNVARLVDRIII